MVIAWPTISARIAPVHQTAYRPDIDGLRAVAVLAVIAFHCGLIPGGFIGVDVFFVISGYLITGIIAKGIGAGTFSFAAFYARRIRRIFPALLLVLIGTLAATRAILAPDEYAQLQEHALAGALFLSNFLLLSEVGYFDTAAEAKPLLHLWSLAIEEQFYLVWPLFMVCVWRWKRRALAVAGLISFALCLALPLSAFYLPFTRFWQLIAGALLIGVSIRPQLVWAGLAMIAGACAFELAPYPGWWALVPTLGAALVIASKSSVLSNRALVYLGLISYPLYLWHWPMIFIARSLDESPLLGAAFAFPLAALTHRLIETPLKLPRLRLVAGSLAGAMALLAGSLAWATRDMEVPPSMRINASPSRVACLDKYPFPDQKKFTFWFCTLSQKAEPTLIVLGDSHANHLYHGLAAIPQQVVLSIGSCQPVTGIDQDFGKNKAHPCTPKFAERQGKFLDEIVKRTPATVILSAKWRSFDSQGMEVEYESRRKVSTFKASDPKEQGTPLDQYLSALGRKLNAYKGRSVVIVLDTPRLPYHPRACGKTENCTTTLAYQAERQAAFRAGLERLLQSHQTVKVFDPMPVFCTFQCDMTGMLSDEDHLSLAGSTRLAAALAPLQ